MKLDYSIFKYFFLTALIGLILFLINLTPNYTHENKAFEVHYNNKNNFTESAVLSIEVLIDHFLIGDTLDKDINTHMLEELILSSIYVDKAEVYLNLRGELNIDVDFRQPFLILLREGEVLYFDADGVVLPPLLNVNRSFLVLSGNFNNKTVNEASSLINQIYDHSMLNKLIGGVHYSEEDGYILSAKTCDLGINIGFNPIVSKNQIDMIEAFYDFLLFRLKCDYCKTINVKYDQQIICIK